MKTAHLLPVIAAAAAAAILAVRLSTLPPREVEIGGYATRLEGRSPGQRHNARLSAGALNGKVIPARGVFSFNAAVRSWSADRGYVKAPVSYDGELVPAFGGGVCQTSTTLYNAALLAGLGVRERHAHVVAPHYVPPGRDAAVAYPNIDLRLVNPYPFPLRIEAEARGDRLQVRLLGKSRPDATVHLTPQVLSETLPARLTRVAPATGAPGPVYLRSPGVNGYRVVLHRTFVQDGKAIRRERLSDNTYPAMNRVIQIGRSYGR